MKNKKRTMHKVLLLICSAVVLVCLSVGATVAYLTAEKSVTNTFTFGKVAISLDEAIVNEYGVGQGGRTSEGASQDYKLIPGHTYVKDPRVTVTADSEESYIRMLVTVKDYKDLKSIFGSNAKYWDARGFLRLEEFVGGWKSDIWKSYGIDIAADEDSAVYEFRYYKTVSTVDATEDTVLEPLFETFTLPAELINTDVAKLEELEINVVAQAIQADTFGNDADAAWAAFVPTT